MPYIDLDFYLNEYYGAYDGDPADFNREARKASDIIDAMTMHKIPQHGGLDKFAPFIQRQVKLATAAQLEYFEALGGWEEVVNSEAGGGLSSVSLGSFSYGEGAGGGTETKGSVDGVIASMTKVHLAPTGLLYRGIGVRG